MAKFELVMPKLGESIIEATITKWLKSEGDAVEEDDSIVEIATDKVDSEIPSPVEGTLSKVLFNEGDVVAVGTVIAIIQTEGDDDDEEQPEPEKTEVVTENTVEEKAEETVSADSSTDYSSSDRFYSPLVKNIAAKEGLDLSELDSVQGSGKDGRVTKRDILNYISNRGSAPKAQAPAAAPAPQTEAPRQAATTVVGSRDQVVEMDRMRKLIADHMVMSKQVSPHVTSFIEVDMTRVVNWRNRYKDEFLKKEGQKLTFTPIFFEVAAKALKDFPGVNASVDGNNVILRKNINIGMATALPSGNLIVPVIKNADQKNITGLATTVNELADKARNNKLDPDDIQGGTFTITNLGSFGSITGTPIINQPQVAILAIGAIQKKPAVIETPEGDLIGIRHKMILALTYDHRVVDGGLGGLYLKRVADLLEGWDLDRLP